MMKDIDYHIHSTHSYDARSTIFELCQKAIVLGLEEIGISDHVDFEPKDSGYDFFKYDQYTTDIEQARSVFKDQLVIWKGIEIDYQRSIEAEIIEWIQDKEFDFIIGSVHYLDHDLINHTLVARNDLRKIYERYYYEVTQSIDTGLFDVIGHFDIVSKYVDEGRSELRSFDHQENVRTILEQIIKTKSYLEMNSKWAVPKRANIPLMSSQEILEEYLRCGGELVSVGSDAHTTKELGSGIHPILEYLNNCNYKRIKLLFA
jgi:histidinol-phosphatase (PHP family)